MGLGSRLARWVPLVAAVVLVTSLATAVGPAPSRASAPAKATGEGLLLYADSTWTGTYSLISATGSTWQRGVRDLFRGGQVIDADFSPNGGSIAFLRTCATCEPAGWSQPSELRILTAGDRRDRLVWQGLSTTNSSRRIYADALAWSPDGSEIATFESPGIVAVDVTTGATRTILEEGDDIVIDRYGGLSWSADDEVAFVGSSPDCTSELCSRSDLYTVDVGAGTGPQLFGRYPGDDDPDDECAPEARWQEPSWSPDGQTLAAYVLVEQLACDDPDVVPSCSFDVVQAERAESAPTPLRAIAHRDDCYGDDGDTSYSDLMEPRWSDDGGRLLVAWNAYTHHGSPVGIVVDVDGPDQDVTTLGDLDPALVYQQLPLPFDWQPCPSGACVAWDEPVHGDRPGQAAVACGRTAFAWVGPHGAPLVPRGDRTCTFVLSNTVAHDLLRLAEGIDGLADPAADAVADQLASHAEDWVVDRLAAKLAATSPRWLRRAVPGDYTDSRQWYLPDDLSRVRLDESDGCIQLDIRVTGQNAVVRERVLGAGTPARTWRNARVDGRRTTVPVKLGLSCTDSGRAAALRGSAAWTRASQHHTLFRARWSG